jgi:hypothetical protein
MFCNISANLSSKITTAQIHMMKIRLCCFCFFTLCLFNAGAQEKFDAFSDRFVSGYKAINLPQLELSYVSDLEHIGTTENIQKQVAFFTWAKQGLLNYEANILTPSQKLDYNLITYETGLNLERLALEQEWIKHRPEKISAGGIITIPNGKAWYAYLLKRWVGADVTPDGVYKFGLTEVARVQRHIEIVRQQTGLSEEAFYKHLNDAVFFESDPKVVQQSFEHTKAIIYTNLPGRKRRVTMITTLFITTFLISPTTSVSTIGFLYMKPCPGTTTRQVLKVKPKHRQCSSFFIT